MTSRKILNRAAEILEAHPDAWYQGIDRPLHPNCVRGASREAAGYDDVATPDAAALDAAALDAALALDYAEAAAAAERAELAERERCDADEADAETERADD